LFLKAISESGSCRAEALEADPGGTVPASGYDTSQSVAIDAGCAAGAGQLACLRSSLSDTLVDSWATITPGPFGTLPLASVHIDGYALNEVPSVMLSEDAADGRPAIFGSNENEMTLFTIGLESTVVDAATLEARLRLTFGNEVADAIRQKISSSSVLKRPQFRPSQPWVVTPTSITS
jgi:carboxylesterase type B